MYLNHSNNSLIDCYNTELDPFLLGTGSSWTTNGLEDSIGRTKWDRLSSASGLLSWVRHFFQR